jgi:carbonic anhydrase/acetyltransferase-like protein (isoleucine patch superfamily)
MPLYEFEGARPQVHPDAWIAPTAVVIGDVVIEQDVSIWYGAVIRADFGRIVIGAGTNIQDNSVVHVNELVEIGRNVTVGHQCLVHDCTVGEQALIGNGALVLDRAQVGARALIAAGAVVTPGTIVPPETVAMGAPAKKFVPLAENPNAALLIEHNAAAYRDMARRHAATVKRID